MNTTRPLFAGRVLFFVALILFSANLRTAVTGLAPLIPIIRETYPLDTFAVALLGALAPLCFAIASFSAPPISRRFGLTVTSIGAILLILVGHLIRASSGEWTMLAVGTLLALLGAGVGNIIMPPLVKKYFPDRIGLMTSIYMSVVVLSATIPPLIAVQSSDVLGWRGAIAQWTALAVVAIIPWLLILRRDRNPDTPVAPKTSHAPLNLVRSPTAWAIGIVFGVSSVTGYAMFAWMPAIMVDVSHVDLAQAGALVALFAFLGGPFALVIPVVTQHLKHVDRLIHVATACFVVGYGGLLFFPTFQPWIWAVIIGSGPLLFPLAMVLINLRTESQAASLQLSGFAQAIAYVSASLAPPLMGLSYELTGGWSATLIGLTLISTLASFAAFIVKRGNTVEQELDGRVSSSVRA